MSLERAGVWAFKMLELRVQEGKEDRKIRRSEEKEILN